MYTPLYQYSAANTLLQSYDALNLSFWHLPKHSLPYVLTKVSLGKDVCEPESAPKQSLEICGGLIQKLSKVMGKKNFTWQVQVVFFFVGEGCLITKS